MRLETKNWSRRRSILCILSRVYRKRVGFASVSQEQMSSSNKNFASKKKAPLPSGWVACRSKSYPDRMYYYNVATGCSSWDEPKYPKSDNVSKT